MRPSHQDTIVAPATALGEAAIGVIRLSGPRSIDIAACHCITGGSFRDLPSHKLTLSTLVDNEITLDHAMVALMRAPRSYTGEDVVEIHCHGGPALIRRIESALVASGARHADPGEFTLRAFLNGKMDLTQAEAVIDLIKARSDVSLASAYFRLRGGLRDRFERIRSSLRETKVLLEAHLDFGEDVEIDSAVLAFQLADTRALLETQLGAYEHGKRAREGVRVVLCGLPNVGKSSLLNALLQQDRAIVTPIPGTTRDTIEEEISLRGTRIVLADTAGLRETNDVVEEEGNRRSRIAISGADIVLLVVDASQSVPDGDSAFVETHPDAILVLNKRDLGLDQGWESLNRRSVVLSAKTGEGLDALRALIGGLVGPGSDSESICHERHADALLRAVEALKRAEEGIVSSEPWEFLSLEVGEALAALGAIVGETTPEDTLSAIFSSFCIGK